MPLEQTACHASDHYQFDTPSHASSRRSSTREAHLAFWYYRYLLGGRTHHYWFLLWCYVRVHCARVHPAHSPVHWSKSINGSNTHSNTRTHPVHGHTAEHNYPYTVLEAAMSVTFSAQLWIMDESCGLWITDCSIVPGRP